jgi:hypothetical protein
MGKERLGSASSGEVAGIIGFTCLKNPSGFFFSVLDTAILEPIVSLFLAVFGLMLLIGNNKVMELNHIALLRHFSIPPFQFGYIIKKYFNSFFI